MIVLCSCACAAVGRPIVDNCLAGYDSSILAYGQTGSGKTYTMLGALPQGAGRVPSDVSIPSQRLSTRASGHPPAQPASLLPYRPPLDNCQEACVCMSLVSQQAHGCAAYLCMSMLSRSKWKAEAVCDAVQGGLIPRLFQRLFERLRDSEREPREGLQLSYICKVSCLEIYQVGMPPVLMDKIARGAYCADAELPELLPTYASELLKFACTASCYSPCQASLGSAKGAVHESTSKEDAIISLGLRTVRRRSLRICCMRTTAGCSCGRTCGAACTWMGSQRRSSRQVWWCSLALHGPPNRHLVDLNVVFCSASHWPWSYSWYTHVVQMQCAL